MKVEADSAGADGAIRLDWEASCSFPGYFRVVAQIPIAAGIFDQLFNGRSGYRAQYYLSPEEGVLYNRDLLSVLSPAIQQTYRRAPLDVNLELIRHSLAGPHSKIWIFEDKLAFDDAEVDTLNPPRWVLNGATRGRKAPLRVPCAVDVKGAFIHPERLDVQVDEMKADRACDLFRKGYT
jgi:hypothetical protein